MVFVIANVQQAIQDLDVKTATHARRIHVKTEDNRLIKMMFVIANVQQAFQDLDVKTATHAPQIHVKMAVNQRIRLVHAIVCAQLVILEQHVKVRIYVMLEILVYVVHVKMMQQIL